MDAREAEPWQARSSADLKANTVVFPAVPGTNIARYVTELYQQGHSGILSVQIATTGNCLVTFSDKSSAEAIVRNGFELGDNSIRPSFVAKPRMALIHNYVSGVQLVRSCDNLGQNAAFLLLPHGNSVPAHPDFDQGIEKIIFLRFPGLVRGKPLNDVFE